MPDVQNVYGARKALESTHRRACVTSGARRHCNLMKKISGLHSTASRAFRSAH
jgi:hypothetical protein